MLQAPVRYSPSVETPEPDEDETIRELVEALLKISRRTYQDGRHALRSVHAKSHALLEGELTVLPGLPEELAQGLFAAPGIYPVLMRLSTTPGDLLDDSVSTPRGVAIKVMGVRGARLPGSEGATTQDIVMVNSPAFTAATARKFLGNLKLLAGTTDKAPQLKSALSATLRGAERMLESVGGHSGTLRNLGGEPPTHPLGQSYFTQVPLRYGRYIAKLSLTPAGDRMRLLKAAPVAIGKAPNALRDALREFFRRDSALWELRAQLCRDLQKMPVEDAAVVWPEDLSPYQPVARVFFPRQSAWNESRARALEEGIAFSPWHGIEAHRPLGSVMRARKAAYEASARFRAEHNAQPLHEPENSPALSDQE
ncbi:MAG TPA: catalase family protein [Steroidobacteraceae bacterium]|nr:catalase family protein [Steroidobacteraceae bacterium]